MPRPLPCHRRQLILLGAAALAPRAWARSLTETEAAAGVRAALERGAEAAVDQLGRVDGYLGNPKLRIPLPGYLDDAGKLLRRLGQGDRVDELITAMNRAAEAAVPEARDLLVATVRAISVEDALQIVRGGPQAATRFFERKTRSPLTERLRPIVGRATERVSLAGKYNAVAGKAAGFGLVKDEDADIQTYVTRKTLDGLYRVIGEEERRIRQDPIGAGSDLLRRVFGG